jgi:hypothetical protein
MKALQQEKKGRRLDSTGFRLSFVDKEKEVATALAQQAAQEIVERGVMRCMQCAVPHTVKH